jgi:hypothetical protein
MIVRSFALPSPQIFFSRWQCKDFTDIYHHCIAVARKILPVYINILSLMPKLSEWDGTTIATPTVVFDVYRRGQ